MAGEPNPGVAAVCSFFFTGLGQIYNGELFKGIILMVIQVVGRVLISLTRRPERHQFFDRPDVIDESFSHRRSTLHPSLSTLINL